MNDDQLRGLFQEMRDEPVPAESLARVREGVAQRIEQRRVTPWKWGTLAALITVGVGIAVWLWPTPQAPAPPQAPPIPQVVEAPPLPPPAVATPARKPRVVSKAKPKRKVDPMEEVVFRMQTEDPEVVILLVN
jgi:hypothetical protein